MAGNTSNVFPKKFRLRDSVERLEVVAWARSPEESIKAKTTAITLAILRTNTPTKMADRLHEETYQVIRR